MSFESVSSRLSVEFGMDTARMPHAVCLCRYDNALNKANTASLVLQPSAGDAEEEDGGGDDVDDDLQVRTAFPLTLSLSSDRGGAVFSSRSILCLQTRRVPADDPVTWTHSSACQKNALALKAP